MTKKKDEPVAIASPEVSGAADGGQSNRTKGYPENPDKPDPSTIAQVEELQDVGE